MTFHAHDESAVIVRIVIETMDAGDDPENAVAYAARWAERVTSEAPFSVEHVHVEALTYGEVLDV